MSRKQRIHDALSVELNPETLIVEDESDRHNVPKGAETHFKLTIISNAFDNLSLIARHRLVNKLLADEFAMGLHALSLHLYTPKQQLENPVVIPNSPACRGGKRRE